MERFSRESAEDIAPTIEQHSLFLFPILLDVSSSDNLLGSETSNGAVSNIAAGAPDNQDDIEVVKAEISFYSTPHTEEFKRPVYDTLMHIKDSCHEDFVAKCSIANSLRRGENPPKQRHLSAIIVEDHRYPKTSGPERREQVRIHPVPKSAVGFRGPASIDGDSDSDNEEDGHDHDHHDHDHHDHDHHGHDHHDHHHDDHHHHHQIEEDVWFTGSLGFGQDGDTCLYENFPVLSNQCQLAVRDLHSLRSTYWEQEVHSREGPPMGHPCFLCVLVPAAFFFFIVFYNLKTRKMRKVNRAVMNAIESNPQLRAQVLGAVPLAHAKADQRSGSAGDNITISEGTNTVRTRTTTTATSVNVTDSGMLARLKRMFHEVSGGSSPVIADGAYASISSDESVHGSHHASHNVVMGVVLGGPIAEARISHPPTQHVV